MVRDIADLLLSVESKLDKTQSAIFCSVSVLFLCCFFFFVFLFFVFFCLLLFCISKGYSATNLLKPFLIEVQVSSLHVNHLSLVTSHVNKVCAAYRSVSDF